MVKDSEIHLRIIAITKVKDAMVLIIDARKVGDVYFKLAKYMLRDSPLLFSWERA